MSNTNRMHGRLSTEEYLNMATHAVGFVASVVAFALLVSHAATHGTIRHSVSFGIYGISLITLYAASTLYHGAIKPALKRVFHILDHAAIYALIAGTYTPFTLLVLKGTTGMVMFGVSWGLALIGVMLKLFFTGRFNRTSTALYVAMGWLIVFAIRPLMDNLLFDGFLWLLAGGISYTVGTVFYMMETWRFNHAIFHLFVLGGSFCHFVSIYAYILPST